MWGTQTFSGTTRGSRHGHLLYLALAQDRMRTRPVTHLHMYHDSCGLCRNAVWGQTQLRSDTWSPTLYCLDLRTGPPRHPLPKGAEHDCLKNTELFDDLHHEHYSRAKSAPNTNTEGTF